MKKAPRLPVALREQPRAEIGLRAETRELLKKHAAKTSHADAVHMLHEYGLAQTLSNVTTENLKELRKELLRCR